MGAKKKRSLAPNAVPTKFSFTTPPKRRKLTEKRIAMAEKSDMVRQLMQDSSNSTI